MILPDEKCPEYWWNLVHKRVHTQSVHTYFIWRSPFCDMWCIYINLNKKADHGKRRNHDLTNKQYRSPLLLVQMLLKSNQKYHFERMWFYTKCIEKIETVPLLLSTDSYIFSLKAGHSVCWFTGHNQCLYTCTYLKW